MTQLRSNFFCEPLLPPYPYVIPISFLSASSLKGRKEVKVVVMRRREWNVRVEKSPNPTQIIQILGNVGTLTLKKKKGDSVKVRDIHSPALKIAFNLLKTV